MRTCTRKNAKKSCVIFYAVQYMYTARMPIDTFRCQKKTRVDDDFSCMTKNNSKCEGGRRGGEDKGGEEGLIFS